jgi:hypothetical protein
MKEKTSLKKTVLRLVYRRREWVEKSELNSLPRNVRGIYALYNKRKKLRPNGKPSFDVVYVGLARVSASAKHRLGTHARNKSDSWTHFSVFEVWPNIMNSEIQELEGLFRHIYRKDSAANRLNVQRSYAPLKKLDQIPTKVVRRRKLGGWNS